MSLLLDKDDGIKLEMVWIPPGSSDMGSDTGPQDERPLRKLIIQHGFWMSKFEITQEQFRTLTNRNPSSQEGDKLPVNKISWPDAHEFTTELNKIIPAPPGYTFRLPTEAEWEYACRAGSSMPYYAGKTTNDLDRIAWYTANSGHKLHEPGKKVPNAFGLYDMIGNLSEWCEDWIAPYSSGVVLEPIGPQKGRLRAIRGGSSYDTAERCTVSFRRGSQPEFTYGYVGMRVVCGAKH